jgi:hypothetical protein
MYFLYFALTCAALYALLIRGWLWRLLILFFSIIGMYECLYTYIPTSRITLLSIAGFHCSYAQVIPALIVLLALLTHRRKQ